MKLRIIIIDDEIYARENLRAHLKFFDNIFEIVAEGISVQTSIPLINNLKPDLVFLDINLGDGTGFDLLEQIVFKDFKLVFLTANNQYAMRALKFSALDYLLKPLNLEELNAFINRIVLQEFKSKLQIENLLVNKDSDYLSKIAIPTFSSIEFYKIEDLVFCEQCEDKTIVYFSNNTSILSTKHLKYFIDLLENMSFERVHQNFHINLNQLNKIQDEDYLLMNQGSLVPYLQRKKSAIEAFLNNSN